MTVPIKVVKKLFVRSRGYCERNGEDFAYVKPEIHHRDRNRENNRMDNLLLLCGNCHSMLHWNLDGSPKKKDSDMMREFSCKRY